MLKYDTYNVYINMTRYLIHKKTHCCFNYQMRGRIVYLSFTLLKRLGLEHLENAKVNTLSGGEQQRVAVARTIIKPGNIILADEPTGALDPKLANVSFDLIRELRDEYGKTILLVTHNMEQARLSDRIIELK